jgi:pyruvate formate lyase activating enzyme
MKNKPVYKIQRYSVHDGPGIRTTLFFQGCPLACPWCHNPESQEMLMDINRQDLGVFAADLMTEIEKDLVFYDDSGGGVTFSGGEPLCHPSLLSLLLDMCREKEIHTCVDTSGYAGGDVLLKAARKTDLMLFDVKLIDPEIHRTLTGRNGAIVWKNLKQLAVHRIPVRLRFPLIPTLTDTRGNISGIIQFIRTQTDYRDIHILPFHRAAQGKYQALGKENYMRRITPPSREQVADISDQFESRGFRVTIGG